ncbi:histidine kinase [Microcella daejeonensis]|uniref:sensor histidine kinase n=1 Tax=Microcella daejeonensis TaxID=2994971 RepID=UPI00227019AC|nr:histidine kinase [Microcella daejeonensis]WAB84405.1 histidine kinase [Microcella daejeonensis]
MTAADLDLDPDGRWRRPRPGRDGMRADALLALGIAAGGAFAVWLYSSANFFGDGEPPEVWEAALMIIGFSGPLVWRRIAPITVTVVISIVYFLGITAEVPEVLFSNIALFSAMYSIGAWSRHRRAALIGRIVIVIGMFGWLFWSTTQAAFDTSMFDEESGVGLIAPGVAFGLISVITNILYFAGAWAFGDRAWNAARERAELQASTEELARERERTAEQAVALDRVRIGRELHDVVAHHVSVMGIQAGAARRALAGGRPDATEAAVRSLEAIEGSARQAVDELHRLVSTLRRADEIVGAAEDGPSTRGTAQLESLVDEVRGTGRAAALSIVGEPVPFSPLIDTTLYRVAREAVTNSLKHAGASAALDVRLRFTERAVELEVADTGVGARGMRPAPRAGSAGGSGAGGGLGQVGMRERLAAVGGTLEAGPRSRGGYLVRASVPLVVAEPTADVAPTGAPSPSAPAAAPAPPDPTPSPASGAASPGARS